MSQQFSSQLFYRVGLYRYSSAFSLFTFNLVHFTHPTIIILSHKVWLYSQNYSLMNIAITDPNKYCFSRRASEPYRQLRPFFKSTHSPETRLTLSLPKLIKKKKDHYGQEQSRYKSIDVFNSQTKIELVRPNFNRGKVKAHKAISFINKRTYNQDRFSFKQFEIQGFKGRSTEHKPLCTYFAVFDGHGGDGCCNFLAKRMSQYISRQKILQIDTVGALKKAFDRAEQDFLQLATVGKIIDESGSCALVALLIENKIHLANVGDSKCIGYYRGQEAPQSFTVQHSPSRKSQYLRIIRNGGKITKPHNHLRISPGNLNVSRTIGDANCKLRKLGGLPNVIVHTPDVYQVGTDDLEYMILATDGLFEGIGVEEIHELYMKIRGCESDGNKMLKIFLESLLEETKKKSQDNITVIIILFQ